MNEAEIKPIFDVIFMMIISLVMVFSLAFGIYKGLVIAWKSHVKSKKLKKIQEYIKKGQFQQIITFNHEGLPTLIEVIEKKEKRIISI